MNRTRLSTTVDTERLERARRLDFERDSDMLDSALAALLERDERERERRAFDEAPYGDDPELVIGEPTIDWDRDLPYNGEVPAEVVALARERRNAR